MEPIESFTGEFSFLSNFASSPVVVGGILFPTVEHAYQALKTLDARERIVIADLKTPGQAKRAGRHLQNIRPNWDQIKLQIMMSLVRLKFEDPVLRTKLLETGDRPLIERNTWGDKYWGMCQGEGRNLLGKILMLVRATL